MLKINSLLFFIILLLNIISFDEEFLIMLTIIISFSQLIKILFLFLNNNYLLFKNNISFFYIYIINIIINYIKSIYNIYYIFENIFELLLLLLIILKNNFIKLLKLFYLKKLYLIKLINIIFLNEVLKYKYFLEFYIKVYKNLYILITDKTKNLIDFEISKSKNFLNSSLLYKKYDTLILNYDKLLIKNNNNKYWEYGKVSEFYCLNKQQDNNNISDKKLKRE